MMRRGAVLLFALIVMSVTVIVTGGLCTYYARSMNIAKFYADQRTSRRVGATRALRTALDKVMEKLAGETVGTQGTPDVGVSLNTQGKTMSEVLAELKKTVPASVTPVGEKEAYVLKAETNEEAGTLTIRAYANGLDGKQREVMSVTIELEYTSTMNTLDVFDYVYFADNNGQLTSDYIIANGEVGSNGDFDLKGATVNGFVRYLNTMRLTETPHAWLQGAYMAKIAAEFKTSETAKAPIEQARPTNPSVYVEGGQTKSVEWPGGYEPPYASNPYTWNDSPPDPVDPPGTKPAAPDKDGQTTIEETDSKSRPY